MVTIKLLDTNRIEDFFQYLSIHISENGNSDKTYFFPLSKEQSKLSDELKSKFKEGLNKEIGEKGWRKTWIALNNENKIVGHIDIRSSDQLNAEHRVVLGMGVDTDFRGQQIGQKLLEFVIEYCKGDEKTSWIDLEVMSNNLTAKKLYDKNGFLELCEIKDKFRINNISFNYTFMTLNVEN